MNRPGKPRTLNGLWRMVRHKFAVELPYRVFTPGHSTPFAFLADAFFHPAADVAAWANRSGGKTLTASILAALEFLFTDNLQARVLAGSEDQATNLYDYWRNWCGGPLAGRVCGRVQRLRTRLAGGRMEILAASQRQVRGRKIQRLFEDELDEIDPDIDAAAVGMIDSRGDRPGRTVYTSTWHRADGAMSRLVAGSPESGVRLHKWNLWESIRRCPVERHEGGSGCEKCALEPACRAKAREFHADPQWPTGIAAEANGLYAIDDAIKAYRKIGSAAWDAEFLCRRPSVEGLVYPEFDELAHRCDDPPPPRGLKVFRSIDWGCGVFVCLWIGEDADGVAYVLDTYRAEHGTLAQHAEYINAHRLSRRGEIDRTFCDPSGRARSDQTGRSNIEMFRDRGIRCEYALSQRLRSVAAGIGIVRAALAPAAGPPKLYYVPSDSNRIFVKAMHSYRNRRVNGVWTDRPQDPQEFEHIPDALRYFFVDRRPSEKIAVVPYGAS